MLAIACLYLCFTGTMFIEHLIMATNHYPLFVAGARIFGGGAFLFALYLLQHKKIVFVQLQQLANVAFFKYVFCLYVLFVSGSAWSMQYMDPVKGCFIFVLSPFMTALMLYFGYQEKLTFKKICGLFVGFFAVVPIILQTNADSATQTAGHLTLIAYGVYAAAVTCFAYGWIVYNKQVVKQITVPSALLTSLALMCGGIITLSIFVVSSASSLSSMQLTNLFWLQLLFFSMLTAVGYHLYALLLKRYSATFISFASFLQPAFGLIIGALLFKQHISAISIVALVALAAGLFLFSQEELG
jgi:drug/metabolite transporter (DMT)-like permease